MRVSDGVVLAVILAASLAWPLRSPPIGLHGEAREGLVVQDLVDRGSWILPHRNGELPSKPPLFHWIAAGAARTAGLSDVTVRLPSALAAWVMAAATLSLGATIGGRTVGWLATGALLGMPSVWQSAAAARVDMVFAASIAVALAGFFRWYQGGGRVARAACWLGAAAAVLAKGPAGAVLVGLVILAFLAVERELGRLRALWSWPLASAALVLAGGWYVLAVREGGRAFIEVQLLTENLDRFVGRGAFGMHRHKHAALRLVVAFATHLVPWNLVVLWSARRRWRGEREDAAGRFLHAWWMVVLGVFTLAAGKRNVYILPLYPALALLAARALAGAAASPRLFGRLDAPARLRRLAPARPALALLATMLVAYDLTVLVATQAVREHREGKKSLAGFAREVERHVGRDEALYAAPHLIITDVWVVAYRLARPLPRRRLECPGAAYYLVPSVPQDGAWEIVAAAPRPHEVALVRCRERGVSSPAR